MDRIVTIRARAFSNEGIRANRCMVDDAGEVRVWDAVANHYTACHVLGESACRRARKLARIKPAEA